MPEQPLNFAVVWWAWLATAILALMVYFDIRRDPMRLISARNVVIVGIFIWYIVEALQVPPAIQVYASGVYETGIFVVMLAAVSFLLGYHASRPRWFDGWAWRVARLEDWDFRRQTLIVGVLVGCIPIVLYGLADPIETIRGLIASRAGWRGTLARPALGDFRASILLIENFLLGVAWIAMLILGDRRRTRSMTLLALAVLAWCLLRAYGTGSRSVIFMAALVPLGWFFWRARPVARRRLLWSVVPIAIVFYWFAGALVLGRGEGTLELWTKPSYVGHEMFRELLFALEHVPDRHPFMYGETILVELLNPIPRFLWEGKPVGFGAIYAEWHGANPLGGGPTFSPGIIGEMYINGGILGVVLFSILGGYMCRAWDNIGPRATRSMPVLMFYTLGLGCFLMMGRSFSLRLFYQLFAALICMAFVASRLKRTKPTLVKEPWRVLSST
jgi:oligosaccharide repeat unit polymerase